MMESAITHTYPPVDVSIVITNYNRGRFLYRAIRSCLDQLLIRKTLEVIVVDDCSTDDSLLLLREFNFDVRVVAGKENRGVAYASNIGLREAKGKYWMRVDADDFLNKHACSIMSMILDQNSHFDFVYCDHYRVSMHGSKEELVRLDNDEALRNHGAGILFRTEALRAIGGYDESLRNAEDYDLLVRINKSGSRGFYLPISLYRYYIHGSNLTMQADRQESIEAVRDRHGI